MYDKTIYNSPLGEIIILAYDNNIVGLWFAQSTGMRRFQDENATINNDLPVLNKAKKWLDDYFALKNPSISTLPLKPNGTKFEMDVFEILKRIPYGKTVAYSEIGKEIERKYKIKKMSSQAVGQAVKRNPISIIIPCHRVIGKNGSLTGYAFGIDKKLQLLKHEGVNTDSFTIPKTMNN